VGPAADADTGPTGERVSEVAVGTVDTPRGPRVVRLSVAISAVHGRPFANYSICARSHERRSAAVSNRRPHSGHWPVSPKPSRLYTQPTHARPDAARTARLIRAVRRREYQIAPNVVVTIEIGIAGRAHTGESHGNRRLSRKGAATAPRAVHTNTAAIQTSYRRSAGGRGAKGSEGWEVTGQ